MMQHKRFNCTKCGMSSDMSREFFKVKISSMPIMLAPESPLCYKRGEDYNLNRYWCGSCLENIRNESSMELIISAN